MSRQLLVFALVALVACVSSMPTQEVDFVLKDINYCSACTRMIDDFSEELESGYIKKIFSRMCTDVYFDDKEETMKCQVMFNLFFSMIQISREMHIENKMICTMVGACDYPEFSAKHKFAKMLKHHKQIQQKLSTLA